MECNNIHCLWQYRDQCCPESEEQWHNATPNELDCPSSLRRDFQESYYLLGNECAEMLWNSNFHELLDIRRLMLKQRAIKNIARGVKNE